MDAFEQTLNAQLNDPEFKKEWDLLQPERVIAQAIVEAQEKNGLTLKELAERAGITQVYLRQIALGSANPSIKTLKRLANGMGMTLKLEFIPTNR